jgi:hypothetical protein
MVQKDSNSVNKWFTELTLRGLVGDAAVADATAAAVLTLREPASEHSRKLRDLWSHDRDCHRQHERCADLD